MADLATAFVSIVPSLKGAQRQIQSQLAGVDLTPAGSELGKQLSGSIGKSMDLKTIGAKFKDVGGKISDVGSKLTKFITVPAVGAAAAVGGVVAAFGWGRLVSLDSAQAKLRGLGYEAKDVEAVTKDVSKALEGGMMTLGEGVSVAAGAMAAGVKQGDELRRHIQLVDAAAIGMNASVDETNQIFNRIMNSTGSWLQELRMIEFRMPGFSAAFAEHMGVSVSELENMVSAGTVGFEELQDAMEDFAGNMAKEYAQSWEGMVANTKAYIGILGENFLQGVFQMSKEELAGFIELLKGEEMQARAKELGDRLRETFELVRAKVGELVDAWNSLDDETKEWIGKLAIAAVAAGPFLVVVGKLVTGVGGVATALGTVVGWLGSGGLLRAIPRVLGPIGLVAGALWAAYESSDEFKDSVAELWDAMKGAWERIWPSLEPVLEGLMDLLIEIIPLVADLAVVFIEQLLPKLEHFVEQATPKLEKLANDLEWITKALDTDEWDNAWGDMLKTTTWTGDRITETFAIMTAVMKGDMGEFTYLMWKQHEDMGIDIYADARTWLDNVKGYLGSVLSWIERTWGFSWSDVAATAREKFDEIRAGAEEKFNDLVRFVNSVPGRVRAAFGNAGNWLRQAGREVLEGFKQGMADKWAEIKGWLNNLTSQLPSWKGPASVDRVILRDSGRMVLGGFIDGMEAEYNQVRRSLGVFTGSLAGSAVGGGLSRPVAADSGGRLLSDADKRDLVEVLRAGVVDGFSGVSGRSLMLSRGGGG